jgi:hypothetical protein
VHTADQVLAIALTRPLLPIVLPDEDLDAPAVDSKAVAPSQPILENTKSILPH